MKRMKTTQKIRGVGTHSRMVLIPKEICKDMGLEIGTKVLISIEKVEAD